MSKLSDTKDRLTFRLQDVEIIEEPPLETPPGDGPVA